ncbi:ParB/RepB/Spo0J family partition protein [Acutalibacter muris]|uniref:Chromosome partitioning protein ParB n=1 Tax=Acutalibacter muris TaxID=1796620 RepID=A0A1Z2XS99_9FIRM|nr:ParB/RepB/Spo0J family partition protein [Acutalibacter muris]ANU55441.1 chromosome partitioning protein ParB [Hungateiclostridiaceae bacterium KB18]ASB41322.1 chromosome partitioning protein ParB [Acutalibacter muris]QQR30589.1 ParB/RepB/Spo0J family partition protein [Acutalibacter muris]
MKSSAAKIQMTGLDALFGEAPAQVTGDQIQEVALSELHPFKDHPFHVIDDEKMQEMAESVAQYGVLVPGIVRPRPEGGYEIIAGHRRTRASELAGKETMPVIVRDMDDDEATIIMVDSNLQREKILPSEKAFAYKMKLEAMNHQGQRSDLTCERAVHRLKSRDILAQQAGEKSGMAITRYISLTRLIEPFLQYVDEGKISVSCAADYLSALSENQQWDVKQVMTSTGLFPSPKQMAELKEYSRANGWNAEGVCEILKVQVNKLVQVTIKSKKLSQYFPKEYTQQQMEEVILSLLESWKNQQKGAEQDGNDI